MPAAANIVPGLAEATFATRAPSLGQLNKLQPRIDRCFEAGTLATGASLEIISEGAPYSEFAHDNDLAVQYRQHAESLGRTFAERSSQPAASTDMANLSLLMPTIHPTLGLSCGEFVNHQPEFAAHCITAEADQADTVYGQRETYPWSS